MSVWLQMCVYMELVPASPKIAPFFFLRSTSGSKLLQQLIGQLGSSTCAEQIVLLSIDLRRNAVTFVCVPVCFCLPLVSACCIQLLLTPLFFLFFFFVCLGFPNEPAADITLNTVKRWIEENPDKVGHASIIHAVNLKPLPHSRSRRLFLTFSDLLWPEMIGPQRKHRTPIVMRLSIRHLIHLPCSVCVHIKLKASLWLIRP